MIVAVLCGGTSGEHEVSVNSGWQVLQHLNARQAAVPVRIDPDGMWRVAGNAAPASWPNRQTLLDAFAAAPALSALQAAQQLRQRGVEAVFVILHGPGGEDGRIQGFLESAGFPYTGSDVLGSALAMDKILSKYVYQARNIPTPPFAVLLPGEEWRARLAPLGLPLVVKAPSQGSSVGMAIVKSAEELEPAITRLMGLENRLLIEQFIPGRELTCGVLGELRRGTEFIPARPLPPTEIRPKVSAYFDYRAKYEIGGSEEITPAPVPPGVLAEVQRLALAAHGALGLGGMSRTDFILGDRGLMVLETNTLPGMTATSLLPQQARAAGLSFTALIDEILERAIRAPAGAPPPRGVG
jgi:D-alanine-D-alanine ligase